MFRKGTLLMTILFVFVLAATGCASGKKQGKNSALMIVAENVPSSVEYFTPKKLLEDNGVKVITASTVVGTVKDDELKDIKVDVLFKDVNPEDFDLISIVGGDGVAELLDNEDVKALIKKASEKDLYLCAICAGPALLAKADMVKDKKVTSWPNGIVQRLLEENGAVFQKDQDVVVDGKMITANGPQSSEAYGKKVVMEVYGEK